VADRLPDRDLLEANKKLVGAWALLTVDPEGFKRMGTEAMAARKLVMPRPKPEPD
jgi:hypothetical protein